MKAKTEGINMKKKLVKKNEEDSNKDVLQMTADEYVEYVKKVMAEDAKLTDKELMAKYRIF